MAGQTRLEQAQEELAASMARIESAWEVVRREHETTQRGAIQLQRQLETLIEQQQLATVQTQLTQKMIGRLGKFGPALLGILELVRYAVAQYLQTHH
jgi:uncharacterized protein with PIN domain